ncbi:hypothetical protein EZS27_028938 [termite gut metagenome]|uniref:Uncharacterized protein n=1 Tax=termite gut metagenome TaxID=433724 RepID=A0A5J4QK57_9ZZZZ
MIPVYSTMNVGQNNMQLKIIHTIVQTVVLHSVYVKLVWDSQFIQVSIIK